MPMTDTLYVRATIVDAPMVVELGAGTLMEKTPEGINNMRSQFLRIQFIKLYVDRPLIYKYTLSGLILILFCLLKIQQRAYLGRLRFFSGKKFKEISIKSRCQAVIGQIELRILPL